MDQKVLKLLQSKKINTGSICGKEFIDGLPYAYINFNGIKILISEIELNVEPSNLRDPIGSLLAATIDFCILSIEEAYILASRKEAMLIRRTKLDKINIGSFLNISVLGVAPRKCIVECLGYEISVPAQNISYNWIFDVSTIVNIGDTLKAILLSKDPIALDLRDNFDNDFNENEFIPKNQYVAIVLGSNNHGIFVSINNKRTVLCRHVEWRRSCQPGDTVVCEITDLDPIKKHTYGVINRLIKKSL